MCGATFCSYKVRCVEVRMRVGGGTNGGVQEGDKAEEQGKNDQQQQ